MIRLFWGLLLFVVMGLGVSLASAVAGFIGITMGYTWFSGVIGLMFLLLMAVGCLLAWTVGDSWFRP